MIASAPSYAGWSSGAAASGLPQTTASPACENQPLKQFMLNQAEKSTSNHLEKSGNVSLSEFIDDLDIYGDKNLNKNLLQKEREKDLN